MVHFRKSSLKALTRNSKFRIRYSTQDYLDLEKKYVASNYAPIPVVCNRAEGMYMWDVEGKKYYDFLSCYGATNQGHRHPRIMKALTEQASKITLTSRAFHNDKLGEFAEYSCQLFNYDKFLPMNTGAEAVETALKIARRWGYERKGIDQDEAVIVSCKNNFHGRTLAIISMSTDSEATENFNPFLPGMLNVPFNDPDSLEHLFEEFGKKICAFLVEPIQGEAGVVVPDEGYLKKCRELCHKYNVLLICDEIQTGIARTGKMMAYEYDDIKPDMIIVGKAISGGVLPLSGVYTHDDIMEVITPGSHGSTYGGNPLACAVATEALKVVVDENLAEKSFHQGAVFRSKLEDLPGSDRAVKSVRGRGLMNAMVINHQKLKGKTAKDICLSLKDKGLLAKPTHENIIRFTPPLIITDEQMNECTDIIRNTIHEFES